MSVNKKDSNSKDSSNQSKISRNSQKKCYASPSEFLWPLEGYRLLHFCAYNFFFAFWNESISRFTHAKCFPHTPSNLHAYSVVLNDIEMWIHTTDFISHLVELDCQPRNISLTLVLLKLNKEHKNSGSHFVRRCNLSCEFSRQYFKSFFFRSPFLLARQLRD